MHGLESERKACYIFTFLDRKVQPDCHHSCFPRFRCGRQCAGDDFYISMGMCVEYCSGPDFDSPNLVLLKGAQQLLYIPIYKRNFEVVPTGFCKFCICDFFDSKLVFYFVNFPHHCSSIWHNGFFWKEHKIMLFKIFENKLHSFVLWGNFLKRITCFFTKTLSSES